jgi:predicted alpha/beta hydrolase family esterase
MPGPGVCYCLFMKTTILLHGQPDKSEYFDKYLPSASNAHWFPWLQKQLLVEGLHAQTPEVPDCYELNYETWQKEVERFEIYEETILVGHSTGGGFWVRYLSERPDVRVGKVVLVAPWLDPFDEYGSDFFKYELDTELVKRTNGITIMVSEDDEDSVLESARILEQKIQGIRVIRFKDKGHFTETSLGKKEFPELLGELID